MPWFRVDDNMAFHHKVIAAGNAAVGLWARAGAACSQQLTDGFVPDHLADTLGTRAQAKRLVEVGLWSRVEGGYRFHEWDQRQPKKVEVEAEREAARERMRTARAAKRSGNVRPNTSRTTPERSGEVRVTQSQPSPALTVVTTSSQSSPHEISPDGLDRIKAATNGTEAHARKTALFVLTKAPTDVRNPTAYVLAAVADDPDAYRYRRGNPTKQTECSIHPGEWGDACRGCAIDQRLGDLA